MRAVDNAKAVLKIGEKVPTATGSFQPGVAGVGVSPLVNTQFTYLDVGVNVEITPKVHENNEVSMHLDIDVSQVQDYVSIGGINEPEISQNKATADVRLREGEVNLIGGIIQQTDSKSTTGIPGLASIPLLGRLFSGESIEKDRTELVIALIPHIVRGQEVSGSNLRGIAAGNATQIKVSYAPRVVAPATPAAPAAATTPAPVPPVSAPPVSAPPATAPPVTGPPVTAPPVPAAPPATAPPVPGTAAAIPVPPLPNGVGGGAPAAPGPARLTLSAPAPAAQLNSTITVTLAAQNITNLAGVTAAA